MTDRIAIAVGVAEELSRELDEDYVGLWVLPWLVRRDWPEASDDVVRALSKSILRDLTSIDVVIGDVDGDTGQFLSWNTGDSVETAMEMWVQLERDPRLGEIAWLVRVERPNA